MYFQTGVPGIGPNSSTQHKMPNRVPNGWGISATYGHSSDLQLSQEVGPKKKPFKENFFYSGHPIQPETLLL